MKKGDQLCILRVEVHSEADTYNLLSLVTALVSMGVEMEEECPYMETREIPPTGGRERRVITWVLKARSRCGQHETRKLIAAWNDPAWAARHPEHPLAYIKCSFQNRTALTEYVAKQAPLALIRKGRRMALIPFDASAETRNRLLKDIEV